MKSWLAWTMGLVQDTRMQRTDATVVRGHDDDLNPACRGAL